MLYDRMPSEASGRLFKSRPTHERPALAPSHTMQANPTALQVFRNMTPDLPASSHKYFATITNPITTTKRLAPRQAKKSSTFLTEGRITKNARQQPQAMLSMRAGVQ